MGYFENEDYKRIPSDDDRLMILACQIRTWKPEPPNWFEEDKGVLFTEVESIEIHQSYKQLIGTCTIRLPRGSVIAKSITKDNDNPDVKSGNGSKLDDETKLKQSSESGQVLSEGSSVDASGKNTLSLEAMRDDSGIIKVSHKDEHLVDSNDFAIGQRIEIWLGYVYNNEDWLKVKNGEKAESLGLNMCFTGFVTACSPTTPLEIQCEDMASILKKKGCINTQAKSDYTINDFFKSGQKFDLLNNTGITLSKISEEADINVGKVNVTNNLVVADILTEWSRRSGLMSFMERDGNKWVLRIGRALYTGTISETNKEYIAYNDGTPIDFIQFDWDVASDNLSVINSDKNFIVIDASAKKSNGEYIRVCVRKPEGEDTDGKVKWDFFNERTGRKKKDMKRQGGESKVRYDVKKSNYVIVPYPSPNTNITMDQLKEEAKAYWKKYTKNGISGSLSVFGDKFISPGQIVGFLDPRQPEKNGYYLVESVTTKFGVQTGYRREITVSYKITTYDKPIKYIT